MKLVSIGVIAQKAGVATSTIRYYERIGLLPPPKRESGKRRYEPSVMQKLGVIRLAQQAGFTIAEIQTLVHDFPVNTPPSKRWQSLAGKKIVELDEMMTQIQAMKLMLEKTLQCHCETLDKCAGDIGAEADAMPNTVCTDTAIRGCR
jgi:MerR family transcriptional regulator, redox-sensitive transcriptional activator SoxR